MQILRSILCLFRRPGVATSPALMHRLSFPSRPLLSYMASAPPRWWPLALAGRVFPLMMAPNPPVRGVSGFPHASRNMASTSVEKVNESGKQDMRLLIPSTKEHSAITQGMKNVEKSHITKELIAPCGGGRPVHGEDERITSSDAIYADGDTCATTFEVIDVIAGKLDARGTILDISSCQEDRRSATMDHRGEIVVSDDLEEFSDLTMDQNREWVVSDDEEDDAQMHSRDPIDDVSPMPILPKSRHRDGSIYRPTHVWKRDYHIADRNETRLEAMMFSAPTDCVISDEVCIRHTPCPMLQFFSLRVAKLHVDGGSVELYGYIAARDILDPLLNYIVNISRDNPIIVEQGSLINMAGPKRGIDLTDFTLIEYEMKIKTGEQEKDDLQLIDGVSETNSRETWNYHVYTKRIYGDRGAIDVTLSCLQQAVEATVEVAISEVQSCFNLCLLCFVGEVKEEIRLFHGAVGESLGLNRSVVAVVMGSTMDLKFKVGTESFSSAEHCCSFKADCHGHTTREIKTDFGLISVRVNWSTIPFPDLLF